MRYKKKCTVFYKPGEHKFVSFFLDIQNAVTKLCTMTQAFELFQMWHKSLKKFAKP